MWLRHARHVGIALSLLLPAAGHARPLSGWSVTGGAGLGSTYQDTEFSPEHVMRWTGALDVARSLSPAVSLRARVGHHHFDSPLYEVRTLDEVSPPRLPGPLPTAARRNVTFTGAGIGVRITHPTAGRVAPYAELLPMVYRARVWDRRSPYLAAAPPLTRVVPGVELGFGVDTRFSMHTSGQLALGYALSGPLAADGAERPAAFRGIDQMTASLGFTWAP